MRTRLDDAHASSGEDPETVDFGPGEKPVQKYLWIYDRNGGGVDNGVWVRNAVPDNEHASYSESKSGRLVEIQGQGEKPIKISDRATRQLVERAWASQIRSNKPYHLRIESSDSVSSALHISEHYRSELIRFAAVTFATFLSLLVTATFLFPCCLVGLGGKFALSSETDGSENTESPQQSKSDEVLTDTDSWRPIPRLKQSWFTYIVGAKITQVNC